MSKTSNAFLFPSKDGTLKETTLDDLQVLIMSRETCQLKPEVFTPTIERANVRTSVETAPRLQALCCNVFQIESKSQRKIVDEKRPGKMGNSKMLVEEDFAQAINS